MPSVNKKILASIAVLFLVVMCWRLFTASPSRQSAVPYSVFLQDLDGHKFQKVSIYMGYDLADLQVSSPDSAKQFVNGIPTNGLPALIKRMLDTGVSVEFARARRFEPVEFFLDNLPLVLLFFAVGYIFLRRGKLA
jgi:ATP-dependent Zn protease